MTNWKLMPVEPTDGMLRAACLCVRAGANGNSPTGIRLLLRTAIAAAPSADLTELRALVDGIRNIAHEIRTEGREGRFGWPDELADIADELEAVIERMGC